MDIHEAFEMSGEFAVNGMTDEAQSLTVITRNIDLEAADKRTTSVEASGVKEEPRERTIFPVVFLAKGIYSLAAVPVTVCTCLPSWSKKKPESTMCVLGGSTVRTQAGRLQDILVWVFPHETII